MIESTIIISALQQRKNAEKLALCNSDIFYLSNNRKVVEKIKKFISEKKEFDLIILQSELPEIDSLFWADLVRTETTRNFDFLLEKLKNRTTNDKMKYLAKDLIKRAHAGDDWTEIFTNMKKSFDEMLDDKSVDIKKVSDLAQIGYKELFKEMKTIKTGIEKFDNEFPYLSGNLIVLAARPGCGKSSLALQQTVNISNSIDKDHEVVLFFSLEMKDRENYARILSALTGIEIKKIFLNQLNSAEHAELKKAQEKLKNNHLTIIDKYKNIDDIVIECKRQSLSKKIIFIVFDYIQLGGGKGQTENERVNYITMSLKRIAMELDCPVLALSQFNRAVEKENREPRLSDLRGSGGIEQDADMVFFIHPLQQWIGKKQVCKIINAKARSMGEAEFTMLFNKKKFQFETMPDDPYIPYSETQEYEKILEKR